MIMDEPAYTHSTLDWRDWWASEDARVYQFIGQDNIYFYCVAQSGMWKALDWNMQQSCQRLLPPALHGQKGQLVLADASPAAHDDLLNHYTPASRCVRTGCRSACPRSR